jgi:diguanylate cyclase (GGDEF)-like protein/PAS domain S-box-containing protein
MDGENTELEGPLGLTAYRVLFERAAEGVIFSTLDGCLQAANPAACALLAMTEEEMLERGRAALIDPDDPELGPWLAERSRTGAGTGQIRLRRGDDRVVDLEVQSRLFADSDGTVLSFSVLHDVTAQTETARALAELSARLDEVALTDRLTGLANRRGLIVAGTELFDRADREQSPVEVLYLNVHNLAELNERAGRRSGDAALVGLAGALTHSFGPDDVVARIAATGFLVLAYGLEAADRSAAVRRMEARLDHPESLTLVGAQVALSFGWVSRRPGSPTSLEDHIARADRDMWRARSAAGNERSASPT